MNPLLLFLTLTTATLVLHSGDRIAVEGSVTRENGVIMFRSGGQLYSMPETEVASIEEPQAAETTPRVKKLAVSEEERKRLIAELEQNHGGTPPPPHPPLDAILPPPPPAEREQQKRDEWSWRREARSYEENIRRAKEDLALLEERAEELKSQIHTFFALGYEPRQFTYQTSQLARAEERIPAARLEVTRAEREWDQFRDDARKQGIPPGWLR